MVLWWAAFFVLGLISPPTRSFVTAGACLAATLTTLVMWRASRAEHAARSLGNAPIGRAAAHCTVAVAAAIILWEGAGIERCEFNAGVIGVTNARSPSGTAAAGTGAPGAVSRAQTERTESLLPAVARLREYLIESLDDGRLSRSGTGIVGALVLDYRRDLGFSLSETYSFLGITHFLALSGMHLGVIAVPLSKMLSFFFRSRNRRDAALFSVLCLYAAIAAFPPSLSRALALSAAVIAHRVLGLNSGLLTALIGGCFVLAVCDPPVVFDAGFQLSFAAVCGIALIGIPLSRVIDAVSPDGLRGTMLKALVFPAIITCSVQFLTMPLTIALFKRASLISPAVNVIVSLPFTVLLYLGVAYVFVPFGPLRTALSFPINLVCRFLDVVPSAFSRGPHPAVYSGDFSCALYLGGVGLVAYALKRSSRGRLHFLLAGAFVVALSFIVRTDAAVFGGDRASPREAAHRQAAPISRRGASFVPWGGGILVVDEQFSTGEAYRLTRELWGKGVREIELCIVQPPRLGRSNGLFYAAKRIALREVLCSPALFLSFRGLTERLGDVGTRVRGAARGDTIVTPSFTIQILGPLFPPPRGASVPADSLRLACCIIEIPRLTSIGSPNNMLTVR